MNGGPASSQGADEVAIREMMIDGLGYADSMAFFREDVAVFDVRSANVVKTAGGVAVPIDVIRTRLDDRSRSILQAHLS